MEEAAARTYLTKTHEREVGLPIAQPDLRRRLRQLLAERGGFVPSNENPRVHGEPRQPAFVRPELRPDDEVSAQVLLQERLHHDPGVGREHAPPATRREHPPRLRVDVRQVELGQHRPRRQLHFLHPRARQRREDEHLDPGRLRQEVVKHANQRRRQEQEQQPQDATHLECDEREVGEGAAAQEQGAVHVGHHRVPLPPHRGALVHGLESRTPERNHFGAVTTPPRICQERERDRKREERAEEKLLLKLHAFLRLHI